MTRIKTVFIILFLVFVYNNSLYADPENYCYDKESWEEWDTIIEKNPDDMQVQALHALRIGLCVKVDRGEITLDQATEIFEAARETIVEKREVDEQQEKGGHKL